MCKIWGLVFALITSNALATTRVAVLDTGYDGTSSKLCATGHYDFIMNREGIGNDANKDKHGTHVANAIIANAADADFCVVIYKVFGGSKSNIPKAIERAVKNEIRILNLSFTGEKRDSREVQALAKARIKGVVFTASGNEGKDLDKKCDVYPACYKDLALRVVGSYNPKANHGKIVEHWEDWCFEGLCGTSLSTGIATGKYIKEMP